jgi:5-methylcytosine-specific restriction endonuclease McrA
MWFQKRAMNGIDVSAVRRLGWPSPQNPNICFKNSTIRLFLKQRYKNFMHLSTPKLIVELVPSTCFFSNVRSTVTASEWDLIRFISYQKAKHKCEICGSNGLKQGYKHRVECHEIWEYDTNNKVQILAGLISLCPLCHQVKHIGRSFAIGRQVEVFNHLEKVNKWTHKQVVDHVAEAFQIYKERSKHQWKLDLSILSVEPYNLKIKITENRKFKKGFFKKKRKKKK